MKYIVFTRTNGNGHYYPIKKFNRNKTLKYLKAKKSGYKIL